jgi:hypothetical protein
LDRLRPGRRMGRAMSMFHGGAWRRTPARGPEGSPRRSVLPHMLSGFADPVPARSKAVLLSDTSTWFQGPPV